MSSSSVNFHKQLIEEKGIDDATGFSADGQCRRFRVIFERGITKPIIGGKLLDYGCGVGGLLDHINRFNPGFVDTQHLEYVGVDIEPKFLSRLHEKYPNVKSVLGCISDDSVFERLDEKGPFDYVISSGAFSYADQRSKHLLMLHRLWKLTSSTMLVNFLSKVSLEHRTPKLVHSLYSPHFGVELAESFNCPYFTIFHEYRENDFTVAFYRQSA